MTADSRPVVELKAAAREAAREVRRGVHGTGLDTQANEHLVAHVVSLGSPAVVSAYMAIRTEIDPTAAMEQLIARGTQVCVPVIVGRDRPLEFREWHPAAQMVGGPFGAAVPAAGRTLVPDVVIAPLLAYDGRGFRLGYGGGYYDRTFRELHARAGERATGVGFAYSAQRVAGLPTDDYDIPLHSVVTELGIELFER